VTDALLNLIRQGLHRDGLSAIAGEAERWLSTGPSVYGSLRMIAEQLANSQDDQGVPVAQYRNIQALSEPMEELVKAAASNATPVLVLQALDRLYEMFHRIKEHVRSE
jgi:hypothetical protein